VSNDYSGKMLAGFAVNQYALRADEGESRT
jgi:hypothetical protein